MKIKKFEAASMKEALEKIKEEMGSDAFILGTKQISKKGPLGFGDRKFLQVTAAIEEDDAPAIEGAGIDIRQDKEEAWSPVEPVDIPMSAPTYNASGRKQANPKMETRNKSATAPQPSITAGFEAVFEAARATPRARSESQDQSESRPLRQEISEIKDLVRDLGSHSTDITPLQKDLGELKSLLYNVIRNQTSFGGKSMTPTLLSFYQKFKDSGMDEALASKLVQIADEKLEDRDKNNESKVMRYLLAMIRQSIDVAEPFSFKKGKGKVVALIGPTGVGKTTTLAKLAAWSSIQSDADVVLITLDTYRIAAVDQLKTYAKIMEIPIQVALNLNEMRQAIQFHHDKSLILIDTAGHSQRDEVSMNNLRTLLADQSDIEVHLVLSATTKSSDLNDIVAKFEQLNPDRLIFTKLDETTTYGPLFSQIVKTKKPVSFLTMGQNVPEDFEFASKDLLAGLFMGKSLTGLKGGGK